MYLKPVQVRRNAHGTRIRDVLNECIEVNGLVSRPSESRHCHSSACIGICLQNSSSDQPFSLRQANFANLEVDTARAYLIV